MKTSEMRSKSAQDLAELIDDCREELFKLRFAAVTDKVDNPARIRVLRKSIARAKTLLVEGAGEGVES